MIAVKFMFLVKFRGVCKMKKSHLNLPKYFLGSQVAKAALKKFFPT